MQSLANRHEDRANRIAMNRADTPGGNPAMSIGTVALAYQQFAVLRARLGNDERLHAELSASIEQIDADVATGYRSLAEAPDGSGDTMAGIGVVNPFVVPAQVLAVDSEAGGKSTAHKGDAAWSDTAPVTVNGLPSASNDPADGNLNGAALSEQLGGAGGWGTDTPSTTPTPTDDGKGGTAE